MTAWYHDAVFYHIYPLGFCDAPHQNDGHSNPKPRLAKIREWIPHICDTGFNALYLGPLFESETHGYDTMDYFHIDRRLGSNEDLAHLVREMHRNGIRVVLDGVFNHVSRQFFAFQSLQNDMQNSNHISWFKNVNFKQDCSSGTPFDYDCWSGYSHLPALNLSESEVRAHLFDAIRFWITEFDIDGLRLDAADVLDKDFLRELSAFVKTMKPDFWLMGEIIHGDYRDWANPAMLHSTTNYECYKGLYSSHNDRNYFEIAYSLNRLFGRHGLYKDLYLYNFADNHDVTRIASELHQADHLYPLHILLFTMPGIPSVYYGSEWGMTGRKKSHGDDYHLRTALPRSPENKLPHPNLQPVIKKLIQIRTSHTALQHGTYIEKHVAAEQFAFIRQTDEESLLIAVNADDTPAHLSVQTPIPHGTYTDILNDNQSCCIDGNTINMVIPPNWGRILCCKHGS